jgi:cell division protein ZapD
MSIETIIFEQPVNEHTRACLRLEQLFQQLAHCLGGPSVWDSRSALAAIIDILNILDRPDLKTKLTKELCRHLANLARLEQTPHVDRKKLSVILIELEDIVDGKSWWNMPFRCTGIS